MPVIKAMIFAAGLGTRFKPWTDSHPKALAPVNGKPLLQRNIEYLQQYGIDEVVVNVHHFPDQIIDAIDQNKGWGSKIHISDERDEVLETGGGLARASSFFSDADLVITVNADILTDLDLAAMISYHQRSNSLITLAVMKRESSRYLLFSADMQLGGWKNIKTGEQIISVPGKELFEFAFSGLAVFDIQVFLEMRMEGKFSLLEVFLDLCQRETVKGFDHSGSRFIDVGKPGSREEAEKHFP